MAADREHNGIARSGGAVVSYASGPVGLSSGKMTRLLDWNLAFPISAPRPAAPRGPTANIAHWRMHAHKRPAAIAAAYDLTAGGPWNGDCLRFSARTRKWRCGAFPMDRRK